ncbi:MAG: hypothetical protein EOO77_40455 [Oxalobacteraceae bacterium]|nr:MAG: hypothetical protein EOO77_40455 [Oxalobacteraceae bacterium]
MIVMGCRDAWDGRADGSVVQLSEPKCGGAARTTIAADIAAGNKALDNLSSRVDTMCTAAGRTSIAPEKLL